jgi:hypothetical protein
MKTFNKIIVGVLSTVAVSFSSCSDFEDINKDPNAVSEENVQVAHLLNKSIVDAQQDPHIAERMFILSWKAAARFDRSSGLTIGTDNDGWNNDYFGTGYGVGWLNYANQAINLGTRRVEEGNAASHENNVLQMARIWRAYLISEMADCFGPIPTLNKYDGTVAPYESVEAIYTFLFSELKDAESKINTDADMSAITASNRQSDPFFNGNVSKWKKYANSLRLRFAMRLSVSDPAKAKAEFEDAASKDLILSLDDMAQVQESDGWHALAGVMSRTWNSQLISTTLNNLYIGLGGIDFQVPEGLKGIAKVHPADYMGLRLENHLTTATNDPSAGFFLNGLPGKIDPRATVLYSIPGFNDGEIYPIESLATLATEATLSDPIEGGDLLTLEVKNTWNTWVTGKWDTKSAYSTELVGQTKNYPALARKFRRSTNQRVWFAPWETYFLLAEAGVYGWSVPGSAKSNYEAGVQSSFEYNGVSQFVGEYIASTSYNRVGTSAAFDHTVEATSHTVNYIDGYTNERKTMTYTYPKNSVYKNGEYNNDQLTKIITQKYLAQNPWLPLEAWNDQRRLGLPFFENQAVEVDYNVSNYEVPLTRATAKETRWEFYPKRMRYPASMEVNSKESYDRAMSLLGGSNDTQTTLWWGKKN